MSLPSLFSSFTQSVSNLRDSLTSSFIDDSIDDVTVVHQSACDTPRPVLSSTPTTSQSLPNEPEPNNPTPYNLRRRKKQSEIQKKNIIPPFPPLLLDEIANDVHSFNAFANDDTTVAHVDEGATVCATVSLATTVYDGSQDLFGTATDGIVGGAATVYDGSQDLFGTATSAPTDGIVGGSNVGESAAIDDESAAIVDESAAIDDENADIVDESAAIVDQFQRRIEELESTVAALRMKSDEDAKIISDQWFRG